MKQIIILISIIAISFILLSFIKKNKKMKIYNITDDLLKHDTKSYSKRNLNQIDTIVVHHSATETGTAESYARYHVNNRDWAGIGYHFVIDQDGKINQTNELDTISYHASNWNTRSIGICLTGNYDNQILNGNNLDSLVYLIKKLKLDLKKELNIIGHRDVANKSCPGNNISIELIKKLTE